MSDVDALIVALADGQGMRQAARAAGMPAATAVREARAAGWPDLDAVRAAAAEIHERHTTTPRTDPGDDVPRKPEPIPIEPDVEAAMAAGAAATSAARRSIAVDPDEAHFRGNLTHAVTLTDGDVTHDVAAEPDKGGIIESAETVTEVGDDGTPWLRPAPGDSPYYNSPEVLDGLADAQRALDDAADAADEDETRRGVWKREPAGTLPAAELAGLIQDALRLSEPPKRKIGPTFTDEQRARAAALRHVTDLVISIENGPTAADLIALAHYVITGLSQVEVQRDRTA